MAWGKQSHSTSTATGATFYSGNRFFTPTLCLESSTREAFLPRLLSMHALILLAIDLIGLTAMPMQRYGTIESAKCGHNKQSRS